MSAVEELIAFVRQQLDADERVAREVAALAPFDEWDAVGAHGDDEAAQSNWEVVRIARPPATPAARSIAQHIARWDPARALAEVEAKRRVLGEHRPVEADDVPGLAMCFVDNEVMPCDHVRWLAQPYAGREGWDARWAL